MTMGQVFLSFLRVFAVGVIPPVLQSLINPQHHIYIAFDDVVVK